MQGISEAARHIRGGKAYQYGSAGWTPPQLPGAC